jgi:hypothetical protein
MTQAARSVARLLFVYGVDESAFLHRDEMIERHGAEQPPLPAVFLVAEGSRTPLITKAEIDACADLDAFIALLQARLASRS